MQSDQGIEPRSVNSLVSVDSMLLNSVSHRAPANSHAPPGTRVKITYIFQFVLTIYNELRARAYAGNGIATLIGCEILDIDQVVGFFCGITQSA